MLATRLRYIRASDRNLISEVIGRLQFKIEIKSIVENGNKTTVWFTLPDHVKEFKNLEI